MFYEKIRKKFIKFSKLHSRKNIDSFLAAAINVYKLDDAKTAYSFGSGGAINDFLKKYYKKFIQMDNDKKRKPDLLVDMTDMKKIKSNSIEIIYCMEVLEHVPQFWKGISEIKRTLKKNGYLVGSTPFMLPMHDTPYDYYRFTRYGLEYILKDFDLLELKPRNTYLESISVIFLRLYNKRSKKEVITAMCLFPFLLFWMLIANALNSIIRTNDSTTGYFFVAQKK